MKFTPLAPGFGLESSDIDVSRSMPRAKFSRIERALFQGQVLVLHGQKLSAKKFVAFGRRFGPPEPHVIDQFHHPDDPNILILSNVRIDGKPSGLADAGTYFHTDYSYLQVPARATMLYSIEVPQEGGNTLFANQYAAWDGLPASLRTSLEGRMGIHSARRGYSPQGMYGERDKGRSMAIKYGESAMKTQLHPLGRKHTETGRVALFASPGYTIGIEGMPDDEAQQVLREVFAHQSKPEYVYRHHWSEGLLTLWDNRCLIHAATGGYEGHRRLLHRITVADRTLQ